MFFNINHEKLKVYFRYLQEHFSELSVLSVFYFFLAFYCTLPVMEYFYLSKLFAFKKSFLIDTLIRIKLHVNYLTLTMKQKTLIHLHKKLKKKRLRSCSTYRD